MVTDYDCWHETEEAVSGEAVMEVIRQNVEMSQEVVRQMVKSIPAGQERHCLCADALKYSLITERDKVPAATVEALSPLIGRYWGA